jgi:antirestriction protein
MKTLKEKYDSIDQSKISAEQKSFLSKIKNVTKDFTTKDKEVNDKIEGALDKMIATFKEKMPEAIKETSSATPKKRNAMSVAKEIRKDGETFTEAKKRAIKKISDDKESAKETIKSELDKLNDFIKSRKKLSDIKGTDLLRDSKRKAKPVGKRISKSGRVYYEYRDSKTDRLSPSYPKNAPYLAGGGGIGFKPYGKTKGKFKITYMADGMKQSEIWETMEMAIDNAKRYKRYDEFSEIEVFDESGKKIMALGGSVVTDLAGHTGGGNGGFNPRIPLDGFSGTHYDGLVGETGAMSSGELFMAGGSVALANQQIIDDASQSYVNYYLGEGASAGIYKDGGAIENQYEGKTPEQIWNMLSVYQRYHFLHDHKKEIESTPASVEKATKTAYKFLPQKIKSSFKNHIEMGQYAKGGGVRKVGNREYSYGRNWTNDNRHINQSEEHEVKYNRKGKFLGIFEDGGALTNEFKEVEDFGSEQFFMRDFGYVIVDDKKIELVVVARLIDLEEFMSEDEIPSEGKFQIDFDLVPKSKYLTKSRKNLVNDEDNSISSVTEINVVNYMGGLRFEPSDKNLFKTSELAEKHLMSKELNDKISGMGVMSGFIMDMPYNRMGKTNWEQLDYILGRTDKFNKGGAVTNERKHVNKGEDYEVRYAKPRPARKGYLGKRDFADGGEFMTDPNFGNFQNNVYAGGGAVKNERKHVNHSEDYEINYAKKRLHRKGYKGVRKFMAGGLNDETPKIYVADLEAYNNGKLVGEWLDLSDYNDADELMDAIQDFLKTSGGGEYAIHDYENLPSSMYSEYMGKRDFEEIYQMIDLAKDNNLPLEVAMEVVSQYGESALDEYNGVYDSAVDFAEELADDIGIQSFIDFTYYLDISETDRRLLSQEMADGYVDDIRSEDEGRRLIEEGELDLDEFEEADYDRKEEMLDEARENVYNEYYDNWYEGLNDPYTFLVEEQGLYDDESFVKANFVQVDYEKLADALEQDYTFIRHDGQVYVFNIR